MRRTVKGTLGDTLVEYVFALPTEPRGRKAFDYRVEKATEAYSMLTYCEHRPDSLFNRDCMKKIYWLQI